MNSLSDRHIDIPMNMQRQMGVAMRQTRIMNGLRGLVLPLFLLLWAALPLAPLALSGCAGADNAGPVPVAQGLSGPCALAVDGQGRLYVAEAGTGRVLLVDRGGQHAVLAEGIEGLSGLVCGHDGAVHAVSRSTGEVLCLGADGRREVVASGLAEPSAAFCERGGALLILESGLHRMLRLEDGKLDVVADWNREPASSALAHDSAATGALPPADILGAAALASAGRIGPAMALSPAGRVYASAAGGDVILNLGRGGSRRIPMQGISGVTGLACDRDGGLFVCTRQGTIWRLSPYWDS